MPFLSLVSVEYILQVNSSLFRMGIIEAKKVPFLKVKGRHPVEPLSGT